MQSTKASSLRIAQTHRRWATWATRFNHYNEWHDCFFDLKKMIRTRKLLTVAVRANVSIDILLTTNIKWRNKGECLESGILIIMTHKTSLQIWASHMHGSFPSFSSIFEHVSLTDGNPPPPNSESERWTWEFPDGRYSSLAQHVTHLGSSWAVVVRRTTCHTTRWFDECWSKTLISALTTRLLTNVPSA